MVKNCSIHHLWLQYSVLTMGPLQMTARGLEKTPSAQTTSKGLKIEYSSVGLGTGMLRRRGSGGGGKKRGGSLAETI